MVLQSCHIAFKVGPDSIAENVPQITAKRKDQAFHHFHHLLRAESAPLGPQGASSVLLMFFTTITLGYG